MLIITIMQAVTAVQKALLHLFCRVPLYGPDEAAGGLLLLDQQLQKESFDLRSSV